MKQIIAVLLALVIVVSFPGCTKTKERDLLIDYSNAIADGIPDDMSLTIYYLPFTVLTYAPVKPEELPYISTVQKILIEQKELSSQLDALRKIDSTILKPVEEQGRVNARLYYFFELGNGDRILEVVISADYTTRVNGIDVEYNSVLYDAVSPFLSSTGDGSVSSSG